MCVHAVWGLGCTILECLSGAPVFNGRPDARCRYTDVSETACCEAPSQIRSEKSATAEFTNGAERHAPLAASARVLLQ